MKFLKAILKAVFNFRVGFNVEINVVCKRILKHGLGVKKKKDDLKINVSFKGWKFSIYKL